VRRFDSSRGHSPLDVSRAASPELTAVHSDAVEPEDRDRSGDELEPTLAEMDNGHLLAALDLLLLELEKRLLRYAQSGQEILQMADEGLLLATRAAARLAQAQSAAEHATSHLQLVGVGDWRPRTTRPSWGGDPRVVPDPDD
jgi:hypothetical protein